MTGITLRGIQAQGLKVEPPDEDGYYFLVDLEDAHLETLLARMAEAGVHGPMPTIEVGPFDRLTVQSPLKLSEAEMERIKARWAEAHNKPGHEPLILDAGATLAVVHYAEDAELPVATDLVESVSYIKRAIQCLSAIPDGFYTVEADQAVAEALNTLEDGCGGAIAAVHSLQLDEEETDAQG